VESAESMESLCGVTPPTTIPTLRFLSVLLRPTRSELNLGALMVRGRGVFLSKSSAADEDVHWHHRHRGKYTFAELHFSQTKSGRSHGANRRTGRELCWGICYVHSINIQQKAGTNSLTGEYRLFHSLRRYRLGKSSEIINSVDIVGS
jgi:hypothetical protein